MQCIVYRLGLIKYEEALQLQKDFLAQKLSGKTPDILLLLEHPPTITIGKSGKLENVLVSSAYLAQEGISLFFTERGGDVTYHGPGQLVAYPIIDLSRRGKDIRRYISELEEVIIRTLKDFSLEAYRIKDYPGVWVKGEQIAAIGLKVSRWISTHGFALNVDPELRNFSLIRPCGLPDVKVTSLSRALSQKVSVQEIEEKLMAHFSEVFQIPLKLASEIEGLGAMAQCRMQIEKCKIALCQI